MSFDISYLTKSISRVHFIPLSSTYKEIYNIHAYFSGPTQSTLEAANSSQAAVPAELRKTVETDRQLRRIARAGKTWKQTVGRTLDMEGELIVFFHLRKVNMFFFFLAYVYRLCLEWARLWADDRGSMNFSL